MIGMTGAARRAEGASSGDQANNGSDGGSRGVRITPTLATTYLACQQAAAWNLAGLKRSRWSFLLEGRGAEPKRGDDLAKLAGKKGEAHEDAILQRLKAMHGRAVRVVTAAGRDKRSEAEQLEATRDAMSENGGAPIIHQAALELRFGDHRWFGYADFLRRVPSPCESWDWSYEVWDAKLSSRPKASHLLQLCLYDDMLASHQGRRTGGDGPGAHVGLMLGVGIDRTTGAPLADADFGVPDPWGDAAAPIAVEGCRPASFRVDKFRYYARRVMGRVCNFVGEMPRDDLDPDPCAHCSICHHAWRCKGLWEREDHLCRTAGITGAQRRELAKADVKTQAALAALVPDHRVIGWASGWRPKSGVSTGAQTLERLAHQALMQKETESRQRANRNARPAVEPLPAADGELRGLGRLPRPDADDAWFDFEGDPLEPGGLEYLNGVLVRVDALRDDTREGFEPVKRDPTYAFRAFWAYDRAQEGEAFDAFVAWWGTHHAYHPGAHLYHYTHYEKSALRRLDSMHIVEVEHADSVLGWDSLIDLYPVVRESLRAGTPSYSIKDIEKLFGFERTADTKGGADSVVMWHAWRDGSAVGKRQGSALLQDIELYNIEDAVLTAGLHDYLLGLAARQGIEPGVALKARRERDEMREAERSAKKSDYHKGKAERRIGQREEAYAFNAALAPERDNKARGNEARVRALCGDLALFHEREERPGRWEYMNRRGKTGPELVDDYECLGSLTADPECWGVDDPVPRVRSKLYRFHVPEQDTKLVVGADVAFADVDEDWLGVNAGTIHEWDEAAGLLTLKRGTSNKNSMVPQEPPASLSLIPSMWIDKENIIDRTLEVCRDVSGGGDGFPHLRKFMHREAPFGDKVPIVPLGVAEPDAVLDAIKAAAIDLDRSWLAIQGPPGTGKTHTIARLIETLVQDGQVVGVTTRTSTKGRAPM